MTLPGSPSPLEAVRELADRIESWRDNLQTIQHQLHSGEASDVFNLVDGAAREDLLWCRQELDDLIASMSKVVTNTPKALAALASSPTPDMADQRAFDKAMAAFTDYGACIAVQPKTSFTALLLLRFPDADPSKWGYARFAYQGVQGGPTAQEQP